MMINIHTCHTLSPPPYWQLNPHPYVVVHIIDSRHRRRWTPQCTSRTPAVQTHSRTAWWCRCLPWEPSCWCSAAGLGRSQLGKRACGSPAGTSRGRALRHDRRMRHCQMYGSANLRDRDRGRARGRSNHQWNMRCTERRRHRPLGTGACSVDAVRAALLSAWSEGSMGRSCWGCCWSQAPVASGSDSMNGSNMSRGAGCCTCAHGLATASADAWPAPCPCPN